MEEHQSIVDSAICQSNNSDRAPIRKPARIVTLYFTTYLRKHLMTNIYIKSEFISNI